MQNNSCLDLKEKIETAQQLVPIVYYDEIRKEWIGVIAALYSQDGETGTTETITIGCENSQAAILNWLNQQLDNYSNGVYDDVLDMYDRHYTLGKAN